MPFCRHFSRGESLGVLAAILIAQATSALAGERIYADSFGNLVIHDPAGFKRIMVGKGYLADRFAHQGDAPKVVYLDEDRGPLYLRKRGTCRYGVLLHGRSHMYGLPDNVVPVPTAPCR